MTGAAGFIGSCVAAALLDRGDEVVGIDDLNDYYDPSLKEARLARLQGREGFAFIRGSIVGEALDEAFDRSPRRVVHLAAQVGVRASVEHPTAFIDTNVNGTFRVLEACRHRGTEHLVFASSSSVYGANRTMPFAVGQNVDHPVSLYAATKKSCELMAHSYSHLFGIPTTGLRFFTVYGPWGRPDMALFRFTKAILAGDPIDLYNEGRMRRDFTYVDDVAESVLRVLDRPPLPDPTWDAAAPDPATSSAPYRIYNVGNHRPVQLVDFVRAIEEATGRTAEIRALPLQAGDVVDTYADIDSLVRDTGFEPRTSIRDGVGRFVAWYRDFYGV